MAATICRVWRGREGVTHTEKYTDSDFDHLYSMRYETAANNPSTLRFQTMKRGLLIFILREQTRTTMSLSVILTPAAPWILDFRGESSQSA